VIEKEKNRDSLIISSDCQILWEGANHCFSHFCFWGFFDVSMPGVKCGLVLFRGTQCFFARAI
jgi:hypothetical protein